jgi:hypothetical protein
LVGEELIHETVDMAYVNSDPNALTDDLTNILLVTNLVHTRLMTVAEEVDIVAIVFSNAHIPDPKVVKRAKELDIDLITTKLTLEEVAKVLKAEFGTTFDVKTHLAPRAVE